MDGFSIPYPGYWVTLVAILLILYILESVSTRQSIANDYPLVGANSPWTPRVFLNWAFARDGAGLLQDGYKRFKSSAFQLVRSNGNIVVLPSCLLEELAALPSATASPHGALEHDLLGQYTGLDVILESRLHHSIVQRKLTPNLRLVTPSLEDAIAKSFERHFPTAKEWVDFCPYQVLSKITARLAAEAIVGPAFSDDPTWLRLSVEYTESLFRTIVLLRIFPGWTHPFLYWLLPSYWRCQGYIKEAKAILRPKIAELLQKNDAGSWKPKNDSKDDINVLSWLIDLAKGRDRTPDAIAHVQVLLALAAVHTTLLRMVNVLYDITASDKSLLDELKVEINQVMDHPGRPNDIPYDRLHKLDSVLLESQRMSPPTILGMKRLFKTPHTFQNGLYIGEGTYVCLPIYALENDPENTANPGNFDGLRSYRAAVSEAAHAAPGTASSGFNKFSEPTPTSLNFGYGRTACPGRFFASQIIKMVFVKLLMEYDFKFLPGTKRPANMMFHEFLFTWPWQRILVKRNQESVCPF